METTILGYIWDCRYYSLLEEGKENENHCISFRV